MEAKMGRILTGVGRQAGKSTMQEMYNKYAASIRDEIDQHGYDTIKKRLSLPTYVILKTWRNRRGVVMHRISAGQEVRKWLTEEHNQRGLSEPEWWVLGDNINITDRLFSLLVLQY